MNSETGQLYPSREAALTYGVTEANLVELTGSLEAIESVAETVQRAHNRRVLASRESWRTGGPPR